MLDMKALENLCNLQALFIVNRHPENPRGVFGPHGGAAGYLAVLVLPQLLARLGVVVVQVGEVVRHVEMLRAGRR